MITINEAKAQCSIEAEIVDFDPLFRIYIPAAIEATEIYCGVKLYEDQSTLDLDENAPINALVITQALKLASLMLISHWFEHREAVTELSLRQVPLAYRHLLDLHKSPTIGTV